MKPLDMKKILKYLSGRPNAPGFPTITLKLSQNNGHCRPICSPSDLIGISGSVIDIFYSFFYQDCMYIWYTRAYWDCRHIWSPMKLFSQAYLFSRFEGISFKICQLRILLGIHWFWTDRNVIWPISLKVKLNGMDHTIWYISYSLYNRGNMIKQLYYIAYIL